ncbi:uncharacterized protein LOC126335626 [Schistocerca gregaria]|uniref:uncharacterized protein LOC126335626 n=1 Tax=Schistocerca gregaria TaxID=7010 RepID=UPI00211E9511|nr:uncharacterized protein LOC126335626 [Schistocerca gregaria]
MIPCSLLHKCSNYISGSLSNIINTSFLEGTFPNQLKLDKIIALYNKGEVTNTANYRPVAILSVFSKIFEYSMSIRNIFNSNNIITSSQYGFRKNISTTHALYAFLESAHVSLTIINLLLGPVLFKLFINDLPEHIPNASSYLHAGNTNILITSRGDTSQDAVNETTCQLNLV